MAKRRADKSEDQPGQLNLFGDEAVSPSLRTTPRTSRDAKSGGAGGAGGTIGPAAVDAGVAAVAAALSELVYLGTSSWSFPGWAGIVYDRAASERELARDGLAAYSRHPLLRAVGIDKSFYAPVSAEELARLAAQTPSSFRFLVKAFDPITSPVLRSFGRGAEGDDRRKDVSPHFLDAAYAAETCVGPFVDGLRDKGGVLVFQFSPLNLRDLGGAAAFLDRLHEFLRRLPRAGAGATVCKAEPCTTGEELGTTAGTGEPGGAVCKADLGGAACKAEPCTTGERDGVQRVASGAVALGGEALDAAACKAEPCTTAGTAGSATTARVRGGPAYAVEIRNSALVNERYRAVLADTGVAHCYNVHPSMPSIAEQARRLPLSAPAGVACVRWMLHPSQRYAPAQERYAPFDQIVDEDSESRRAIASLARAAAAVRTRILVIANNKAEGSAPRTCFRLAADIAGVADETSIR